MINDNGKIAIAAHTEEFANSVLSCGKNVLLCSDDELTLFDISSMKKIHINKSGNTFNDYDIAEYTSDGSLYKIFDAESDDTALILSGKCNSNCIMCPYCDNYRKNAGNVLTEKIMRIIDYISIYPNHLTITGGEPTLIGSGIFDIMTVLKNKFPETKYLFLTNGRVFSDEEYCEKMLAVCPDDICFAIPIYGNSPQTHDSITRSPDSFVQAVKGMQYLMKKDISVEIRIVVSRLNADNMQGIAEFISKYLPAAHVVNLVGLEMCGNAARNRGDVWISYTDAFEKMKAAIEILCGAGIDCGIYNFPLCAVDKEYRALCRRSISGYKIVYPEACNECSLKEICGGFFKSTFLLKKPEVTPVII